MDFPRVSGTKKKVKAVPTIQTPAYKKNVPENSFQIKPTMQPAYWVHQFTFIDPLKMDYGCMSVGKDDIDSVQWVC